MTSPTTRSTRTDKLFPYTTLFPSTPHLRKSLMKLFVRTSAFFAAVLIATGTIAGVGQANAQTNPLDSQIRAILDANPEIVVNALDKHQRSEEHTSELQPLMRISYPVFCLKQQNRKTARTHHY